MPHPLCNLVAATDFSADAQAALAAEGLALDELRAALELADCGVLNACASASKDRP